MKSDHRSKFSNLSNWKEEAWKIRASTGTRDLRDTGAMLYQLRGGGNRGVNLPSPYFLSQFLPPPFFFEPISPSSLNSYVSFSPSSLLFPLISPSSHLFLGHFSLLPNLFLHPLKSISRKNTVLPIKKFSMSYATFVSRNTIMLQLHLIIHFPLYYWTIGCLSEVKKERKFQSVFYLSNWLLSL